MNFLAHLYLAGPEPQAILGNLLADFVKRAEVAALPAAVRLGIAVHRQVDAFTDCHPVVQRSICRISQNWGWFSGILIDVYSDHLLATNWARFSDEPLRAFVDRMHGVLSKNAHIIPHERERILQLIASDRLYSYRSLEGIDAALQSLSQRIEQRMPGRSVCLQQALPDLRAHHAELEDDFRAFFPELISFARPLDQNVSANHETRRATLSCIGRRQRIG